VVTATPSQRVLVVDDDPTVAEVVTRYLEREGFAVEAAGDGLEALNRAAAGPPDLVVLDLMLPGLDGMEVCRRLREMAPIPIIMLTALGDESERVAGLEFGADDYIAKPFSPRELVARAKAVLRRAAGAPVMTPDGPDLLEAGDILVDVRAREIRVRGELVALTVLEFDLLTYLMRHPKRALRREDLLDNVWGFGFGDTSTVTVHVRRLREKIERDPARPRYVTTVWGVGYRFDP
jgi:DNA-binding response OmpR family regulator